MAMSGALQITRRPRIVCIGIVTLATTEARSFCLTRRRFTIDRLIDRRIGQVHVNLALHGRSSLTRAHAFALLVSRPVTYCIDPHRV
jgi:hypothetical protein